MLMRRYLLTTGTLYIVVGIFLLIHPIDVYVALEKTPIFQSLPLLRYIISGLFILAGILSYTGGIVLHAVWQGIAITALAGVGTTWCVFTTLSAIIYNTDIVRPVLWLYILLSIYRSIPYSAISKQDEQKLNDLLTSIHQTIRSVSSRKGGNI